MCWIGHVSRVRGNAIQEVLKNWRPLGGTLESQEDEALGGRGMCSVPTGLFGGSPGYQVRSLFMPLRTPTCAAAVGAAIA